MSDSSSIDERFTYRPPTAERAQAHNEVRAAICQLAHFLNAVLPNCREKSIVLTKLEETMFWANAGIARQPE